MEVLNKEEKRILEHINTILENTRDLDAKSTLNNILIRTIDYIKESEPTGGFWAYLLFVTPYDLPEQIIKRVYKFKEQIRNIIFHIIKKGITNNEFADEDVESIIYAYICFIQGNIIMQLNSKDFKLNKVYKSWNYFWEGIKNKE